MSLADCCSTQGQAELIVLAARRFYGEDVTRSLEWIYSRCDCHG